MSVETRIKSLNQKHMELEAKLHRAYIHHLSTAEIKQIKAKKLMIKDEIEQLAEQQAA
jgi:hypothetical protein